MTLSVGDHVTPRVGGQRGYLLRGYVLIGLLYNCRVSMEKLADFIMLEYTFSRSTCIQLLKTFAIRE